MRRVLPLLLILTTLSGTGLFDALGLEREACEEEGAADCSDCAEGCAVCLCCPRVVNLTATAMAQLVIRRPEAPRALATPEPSDSGYRSDIFQPPRV